MFWGRDRNKLLRLRIRRLHFAPHLSSNARFSIHIRTAPLSFADHDVEELTSDCCHHFISFARRPGPERLHRTAIVEVKEESKRALLRYIDHRRRRRYKESHLKDGIEIYPKNAEIAQTINPRTAHVPSTRVLQGPMSISTSAFRIEANGYQITAMSMVNDPAFYPSY